MSREIISAILILFIFVLSGINKTNSFQGTVKSLITKVPKIFKKLPMSLFQLAIIIVILIEILAPILIVYSYTGDETETKLRINNCSIYTLILFLILATLLYHYPNNKDNLMRALLNVSIIGGLILLLQ